MSTLRSVQHFNLFGNSQPVLPSQCLLFDRNFEKLLRKIGQANKVEFWHQAMIWTQENAQKVWEQSGKERWHFLHRKPHWTEMKNNYWGIILGLGQKSLGILDQHMTQRNFENYLEIIEWTEIQVASQPRANEVIPLIEKEYSQ